MKQHFTFLLLVCILMSGACFSQVRDLKFKHLTTKAGLSQNTVTSIMQDSKGFMWFGTHNGLNKYDGYKITIYKHDPENPASISNNRILNILEDRKGTIWVATDDGLNKFDRASGTFSQLMHDPKDPSGISSNSIMVLHEDRDGNLWAGTAAGLNMLDVATNKFVHYVHNPADSGSLSSNSVSAILEDSEGNLWAGSREGGLCLFNKKNKTFTRYLHDPLNAASLSNNNVKCIFEDSKKNLWIGTYDGLNLFNKAKGTFTRYKNNPEDINSLRINQVMCLTEDENGLLWIGTENGGINLLNHQEKKIYRYLNQENDPTALNSSSIYSFLKDRQNNIWIGTFNGGVNLLDWQAKKFKHFQRNAADINSLTNDWVSSFSEDKKGKIWVGTGYGLASFDPEKGSFKRLSDDPAHQIQLSATALLTDRENKLWIGTWGSGITVVNPERTAWTRLVHDENDPESLPSDFIKALKQDSQGVIWVGTSGKGLAAYHPATEKFKTYSYKPDDKKSISSDFINCLLTDSKGNLWVGTEGGGLNLFDKKSQSFVRFENQKNDAASLSNNHVYSLLEDSKGFIWAGTSYGLNRLDPASYSFIAYYEKDGLSGNTVKAIQEDETGQLWISGIDGLTQFNPETLKTRHFTAEDNLQKGEFNSGSLKSSKGDIYLSSSNGFNVFLPSEIKDNEIVPPVYITGFQLFNKEVVPGKEGSPLQQDISGIKELTLSYLESVFSFDFAALGYSSPEKNNYAYMMVGFDKGWNHVQTARKATYTNLDPGDYTFRVKASNNDGVWNEEGTALQLIITPPFWQTWWFRTLMLLAITGSAVTFYTVRINAERAQKITLEKLVKEKTANLQEANNELTERQEEILLQQEELGLQRDHLKIVNDQVMSSIQYAQTIQKAILPARHKIEEVFPEHFIIYRPKDVVSGDFYWFSHPDKSETGLSTDISLMAAVDCTGHGVPGAFMSIIGSTILNEIVNQKQITDPAKILELLHLGVRQAVDKAEGINTAGMDVCLCLFERGVDNQVKIQFSGAKRDLIYVRAGSSKPEKLQADRRSIGSDSSIAFTTQELVLDSGSMVYLTTDGYTDQNNLAREKMGSKTLDRLIKKHCGLGYKEQQQILEKVLDDYQEGTEQRDDITLIGLKI